MTQAKGGISLHGEIPRDWQTICVVSSGHSGGQGNKQVFVSWSGLPAVYTV